MGKIKSSEHIFPFQCNNHECNREYDLEAFTNVAFLWGLIFLSNNDRALIGITCPDCFHSTVKKYPLQEGYTLMSGIEQKGIQLKDGYQIKQEIKYFVPFSEKILNDLSLIDNDVFKSNSDTEVCHQYRIPFGFEPIRSYPESIASEFPYSIDENLINTLVEIENTEKYKTLPRIIPQRSIYPITDEFLFEMNQLYETKSEFLQEINETFVNLIRPGFHLEINSGPQNPTNCYDNMILDDLTPDEIANMDLSLLAWERKSFQEGISEFIDEYRILRNQIDFEIIYRKKFLNTWARRFYFEEGYKEQIDLEALDELQNDDEIEFNDSNIYLDSPIQNQKGQTISGFTNKLPTDNAINKEGSSAIEKSVNDHSLSEMIEIDLPELKDIDNAFVRKGSNWYIKFKGKPTTLNDNKRLHYVVHLLNSPNQNINNIELVGDVQGTYQKKNSREGSPRNESIENKKTLNDNINTANQEFHVDQNLSKGLRQNIKDTVKQLLDEKIECEKKNNLKKIDEINKKIEKLRSTLKKEYNAKLNILENNEVEIKAREIKLAKEADNARTNVRNNLNNAFQEIGHHLPQLESHLLKCVDTKQTVAAYKPQKSIIEKSIKWYISW